MGSGENLLAILAGAVTGGGNVATKHFQDEVTFGREKELKREERAYGLEKELRDREMEREKMSSPVGDYPEQVQSSFPKSVRDRGTINKEVGKMYQPQVSFNPETKSWDTVSPFKVGYAKTQGSAFSGGGLTPEAIEQGAERFILTGEMPSFGMGGMKNRELLQNRVAEKMKEKGLTQDDLISNKIRYESGRNAAKSASTTGARVQDAKVNQAKDLRALIDQNRDPETGEYKIPPSMHTELAMGVARLISPGGVVASNIVDELTQRTAREGLSGAMIYLGFDPKEVGGTTQSVTQFMVDMIERQGNLAEELRDQYYLKGSGVGSGFAEPPSPKNQKSIKSTTNQTPIKLQGEKGSRLQFLRDKKSKGTIK